jgi:predicted Zn-ribbon and HTH transcriptional regulator
MEKLLCKKCGYQWIQRIESKPKCCPGCKSPKWWLERIRKKVEGKG